jgi:hypothetical protein
VYVLSYVDYLVLLWCLLIWGISHKTVDCSLRASKRDGATGDVTCGRRSDDGHAEVPGVRYGEAARRDGRCVRVSQREGVISIIEGCRVW